MSSSYNRNTELRNVHTKDLYNLAIILDNDNNWQILMEAIPQELNNETFGTQEDLQKISSSSYKRKYSNDHIRILENAICRHGESRLHSQILFDEWGSSGRKHERPTLGVLMHLLVQSKLYRAADFLAELLNESKPSRPVDGPAAEFEFELNVFNDIHDAMNDTRFYPNTEDLQENINNDVNKDYYIKYHKNIDSKLVTVNVNSTPPKPPPRLIKSAKLLNQQQKYRIQQLEFNTPSISENMPTLSLNIPQLSLLLNTENSQTTLMDNWSETGHILPKLSTPDNVSNRYEEDVNGLNCMSSVVSTNSNISEDQELQHKELNSISKEVLNKAITAECEKSECKDVKKQDFPAVSAKDVVVQHFQQYHNSINSENVHTVGDSNLTCSAADPNYNSEPSSHQLDPIEEDYNTFEHEHDNDIDLDIEDDEDSLPNLSFLDNRSSNNESSLTSVTNTSGDNSFEQSSSNSTDNVPFLSIFDQ